MYVTPKLSLQITKQSDEGSCCTMRCWLLVWGILRLVVSVLWTGTITLGTIGYLHRSQNLPQEMIAANYDHDRARLWFDIFAILVQLVEFGMIITFILAGIKKSASLYRAYYRYCIITLAVYIIAVILCSTLVYDDGHYFGEIYLSYHIDELPIAEDYFYVGFDVVAVFVVGLEILLICLIKKLINRYSSTTSCQHV